MIDQSCQAQLKISSGLNSFEGKVKIVSCNTTAIICSSLRCVTRAAAAACTVNVLSTLSSPIHYRSGHGRRLCVGGGFRWGFFGESHFLVRVLVVLNCRFATVVGKYLATPTSQKTSQNKRCPSLFWPDELFWNPNHRPLPRHLKGKGFAPVVVIISSLGSCSTSSDHYILLAK